MIWGAGVVIVGAQNMSIGISVVSILAPLGSHRAIKGRLGVEEGRPWGPGLDFYRCCMEFGTACWKFLANFGATMCFLFMLVSRSRFLLMISGSESGFCSSTECALRSH